MTFYCYPTSQKSAIGIRSLSTQKYPFESCIVFSPVLSPKAFCPLLFDVALYNSIGLIVAGALESLFVLPVKKCVLCRTSICEIQSRSGKKNNITVGINLGQLY